MRTELTEEVKATINVNIQAVILTAPDEIGKIEETES